MTHRPIDLERARREAKALVRAARAGDPDALGRLRRDREPRLADAQRAVARDLGEPSWPALVRRVEAEGAALLDASRAGDAEAVYRLLEAGAPANARDPESGGTALHVAASLGRLDVIDVLVGWVPVDRLARDRAGRTALKACLDGSGDPVVAKVLVSVGIAPEPWMLERLPGELAEKATRRDRLTGRFGELAWAADVAMSESIAGSPLAETRPVGDGFAFATGLPDNTRNGVVCSRLAGDADTRIAETLTWLRARGPHGQWLLAEDTEPADLRERLIQAGCTPERTAVHMAAPLADLDLSARPAPAGLEIARTSEPAAFDDPGTAQLMASLAPVVHYAAVLDGRTVGAGSVLVHGTTLAGLELHVERGRRRRGVGRALVLHALREGRSAGCAVATLAPTPATVPFYEALGFVLGRYPPDRAFYTPDD